MTKKRLLGIARCPACRGGLNFSGNYDDRSARVRGRYIVAVVADWWVRIDDRRVITVQRGGGEDE